MRALHHPEISYYVVLTVRICEERVRTSTAPMASSIVAGSDKSSSISPCSRIARHIHKSMHMRAYKYRANQSVACIDSGVGRGARYAAPAVRATPPRSPAPACASTTAASEFHGLPLPRRPTRFQMFHVHAVRAMVLYRGFGTWAAKGIPAESEGQGVAEPQRLALLVRAVLPNRRLRQRDPRLVHI